MTNHIRSNSISIYSPNTTYHEHIGMAEHDLVDIGWWTSDGGLTMVDSDHPVDQCHSTGINEPLSMTSSKSLEYLVEWIELMSGSDWCTTPCCELSALVSSVAISPSTSQSLRPLRLGHRSSHLAPTSPNRSVTSCRC